MPKSAKTKEIDPIKNELMHIEDQKETWSECILEDGTRIRIRPVVTEVRKLEQLGLDGKPVFAVKTALVTDVRHPVKKSKKVVKK